MRNFLRALVASTILAGSTIAQTAPVPAMRIPFDAPAGSGSSWRTSSWSSYSSTCSATATRTRAVWCQQSDGTTVADANCTGTKPASAETTADYSSCGYTTVWGTKILYCSGPPGSTSTQRQMVTCRRSDNVDVGTSNCGFPGDPTYANNTCTVVLRNDCVQWSSNSGNIAASPTTASGVNYSNLFDRTLTKTGVTAEMPANAIGQIADSAGYGFNYSTSCSDPSGTCTRTQLFPSMGQNWSVTVNRWVSGGTHYHSWSVKAPNGQTPTICPK